MLSVGIPRRVSRCAAVVASGGSFLFHTWEIFRAALPIVLLVVVQQLHKTS